MGRGKQTPNLGPVMIVRDRSQIPEGANIAFEPQEGPQTDAYLSQVFMILYGGARGGGKTEVSIAKTIAGNPYGDQSQPYNISYVFHPGYRALVLRRNFKDLLDYKDRAAKMYEYFGGRWNATGSYFEFAPYGEQCAKIVLGHLDSEDSYRIYLGQQYQRIFIEEVSQIPSETLFLRVISSCRSPFKELKRQVFLTANPEGAGFHWVKKMFMTDPVTGKKVPPNTRIVQEFVDPVTGAKLEMDRIFIPAKIWDNKHLLQSDPSYVAWLMSLPDALKRAYLDGDWDAISGSTFFTEFRPKGPMSGEPEWADHCVDSREVFHMPWQRMWCGLDWAFGHFSVVYWFFENDADNRIYVCDELAVTRMGSYDLGVEWAKRSLPYFADPDGRQSITIYMSPDAWQKRDQSPEAEEISVVTKFAKGIKYVLGSDSVYIPGPDEMGGVPEVNERLDLQKRARVIIKKAPNHRVTGWGHCRELLDWRPRLTTGDFDDQGYLHSIMDRDNWQELYTQYIKAKEASSKPQILPRMKIFRDKCPRLLAGIEAAVFAEDREDVLKIDADPQTGKPGDDEIDAWRYGCAGWTREHAVKLPMSQRWLAEMRKALQKNPDLPDEQLAQVRHAVYLKELGRVRSNKKPMYLARRSSAWNKRLPANTNRVN